MVGRCRLLMTRNDGALYGRDLLTYRSAAGGEAARADFSSPSGRFLRLFRDRGLYPFGCWRGAGAAVFLIPVQRDQQQRRHAEQRGDDEEVVVAELLHHDSGVTTDQARQQEHDRAEQGVLGGRELEVGQARQVGNERRGRHARTEVVQGNGDNQHLQVGAHVGEHHEQQVGGGRGDTADEQDRQDAETYDQQAAHAGAEQRHDQAENFADAGNLILGEALVDIEHVSHYAHDRVGHSIGSNQPQQQEGLPAVAQDKVVDRRQHRRQAAATHGRKAQGGEQGVKDRAQEGAVFEQQVEQAYAAEQHTRKVGVIELGEHGGHGYQQHDQHEHRHQLMRKAVAPGLKLRAQWHRRFAHKKGGEQRRDHQGAKQHIGAGPGRVLVVEAGRAEAFREEQRTGGSQQRRDPISLASGVLILATAKTD